MSELAVFLKKLPPCGLGEVLRSITFVGNGLGCYENFDVREDARQLSQEQIESFLRANVGYSDFGLIVKSANGYTFQEGSITIDVFWYWDGDGTLQFRVKEGDQVIKDIINTDCKMDSEWEELEPSEVDRLYAVGLT